METKEMAPASDLAGDPPGIVVLDRMVPPLRPVIAAFIWGGPPPQQPTLPFGRWKVVPA